MKRQISEHSAVLIATARLPVCIDEEKLISTDQYSKTLSPSPLVKPLYMNSQLFFADPPVDTFTITLNLTQIIHICPTGFWGFGVLGF